MSSLSQFCFICTAWLPAQSLSWPLYTAQSLLFINLLQRLLVTVLQSINYNYIIMLNTQQVQAVIGVLLFFSSIFSFSIRTLSRTSPRHPPHCWLQASCSISTDTPAQFPLVALTCSGNTTNLITPAAAIVMHNDQYSSMPTKNATSFRVARQASLAVTYNLPTVYL